MEKLFIPPRENEVADHAQLVDTAAQVLPLGELVCKAEQYFTPNNEVQYVYVAPPGKAIRIRGHMLIHEADRFGNPDINDTDEFVAYSLEYEIIGLNRGGSVHKQGKEHEPPPGETVKLVSTFPNTEPKRDLPRPRVRVTLVGRPEVEPTVYSGDLKVFETNGKKFRYEEEVDGYSIRVPYATADMTGVTVEIIDDPKPPKLEPADMAFVNMVKEDMWFPRHSIPVGGTTGEDYARGNVDKDGLEVADPKTIEQLKEWYWREFRYSRGRALPDDPYPESARLRLASTIDNEGNNARLYGPYEGISANSDLGHLELPDGSKKVVRVMERDELLRRCALQHMFRRTGWEVWGGRE